MKFSTLNLFRFLTPNNFKRIANIFLLGVLAFIPYYLGDLFLAVIIVLFTLLFLILRRRYFILLVVPILGITLFLTPVLDAWTKLKEADLTAVQQSELSLANIFTAGTGQEVLPVTVQHMLALLHKNHIDSYRLSNQFALDPLIQQRILEAAWPIKVQSSSRYRLISPAEITNNSVCTIIDQEEDVVLEQCH